MSSLDEQLQALEQQHRQPTSSSSPSTPDLDDHLAAIAAQFQEKSQQEKTPTIPEQDPIAEMLEALEQDSVTQQLKQSQNNQKICHAIADVIEKKRQTRINTTHNAKAIAAAEKQKQAQQKRIRQKAEQWLQNLDPISNEGMWFYEFAETYESRLDAAMDYLMALE
ncbi:salt stress protein, Slr1339 family [[Limnothrix rosea] IAM M-220]|uniref:salt stress protein, Slr1339 family n=1 Tax=[Limnothrix rosea] IAM M-220 TaxID=454133 RepID=UPI0009606BC6|nr:hypothetical protein [[Limnothrix rosea] IAM M-220]OKH17485.1 hypothetical protein NIES208_09085 [[Limnothrix rosea] IAM M-220]